MDKKTTGLESRIEDRSDSQRFGDELSRAIVQTGFCWSTDVIDPPVSKFLQDRFGRGASHKQVWYGEFIGDTIGGGIYIALKQLSHRIGRLPYLRWLGDPIDRMTDAVGRFSNNSLTRSGEKALKHWAEKHQIDRDDPRYQRRLENYKHHQAETMVDSWIVAGASAGANVAAQRYLLGNKNDLRVIGGSKLVGSAATLTLLTTANKILPHSMHRLETELSDHYFSPVADFIKSTFGIPTEQNRENYAAAHAKALKEPAPVLETLLTTTATALALQKLHDRDEELVHLLPKGIGIGAVATAGMLLVRALIPQTLHTFNEELHNRYAFRFMPWLKRQFGIGPAPESVSQPPVEEESMRPIVSLADAPLIKKPLSRDKQTMYLQTLHRDYAGGSFNLEHIRTREKHICNAFIPALDPNSAYAAALAEAHYHALKKLKGDDPVSDAQLRESAKVSIQSILLNRRDDMHSRLMLLDDANFLNELADTLAGKPIEKSTPSEKKESLIESLVQTRGPLAREPAVHIYANAKGQIIEHQALADCFDPRGPATQALAKALSNLPNAETIARDYTAERQKAAALVVKSLALDGEVVNEAVRRSEAVRLKNGMRTTHAAKEHGWRDIIRKDAGPTLTPALN